MKPLARIRNLLQWSAARFPLPGVLSYAAAMFYLAYSFGGLLPGARPADFGESVLGCGLLVLLLLRLRVTDEHKDFSQDAVAYPERLLSRGLVTLRQLYGVFCLALALEIGLLALLRRPDVLPVWLVIQAWFLLMFIEFGVPKFLNAHIGWYLVSHQLLLPLFALLPIALRVDLARIPRELWPWVGLFLLALMCGTMTYEIARKTWSPERETPHAVSYSRDWGLPAAILVNQGLAWSCGGLLVLLVARFTAQGWVSLPMAAVLLAFLVVEVRFARAPNPSRSQQVECFGAAAMFGAFGCGILAFSLAAAGWS